MPTDQYLSLDLETLRSTLAARLHERFDVDGAAQCERALALAERVHGAETRDEGTPYILHPMRVALRVLDYVPNAGPDDVCTAFLHDAIESGGTTAQEIEEICGEMTARSVQRLTHDGLEPKSSYLTALVSAPRRIQRIKLADRLDNVWGLLLSPEEGKHEKYLRETEDYVLSWGRMVDRALASAIEEAVAAVKEGMA